MAIRQLVPAIVLLSKRSDNEVHVGEYSITIITVKIV